MGIPTLPQNKSNMSSSYPTYSVGSYRSEPSQPSVIRLSSDSSTSSASPAPLIRSRGFICTRVVPRGQVHARGGGRGDVAPGGFGNRFLPPDE